MRSPVLPSSTQRRTEAGEPQRGAQGSRTRHGKAHPRDRQRRRGHADHGVGRYEHDHEEQPPLNLLNLAKKPPPSSANRPKARRQPRGHQRPVQLRHASSDPRELCRQHPPEDRAGRRTRPAQAECERPTSRQHPKRGPSSCACRTPTDAGRKMTPQLERPRPGRLEQNRCLYDRAQGQQQRRRKGSDRDPSERHRHRRVNGEHPAPDPGRHASSGRRCSRWRHACTGARCRR